MSPETSSSEATQLPVAEVSELAHNTRRMLQALDAYWLGYDLEDWWYRFEKYRANVERALRASVPQEQAQ